MGLLYVGYRLDQVVLRGGRIFKKKDLGKMVDPPLRNEDDIAEQWPKAFCKCDDEGNPCDTEKVAEMKAEANALAERQQIERDKEKEVAEKVEAKRVDKEKAAHAAQVEEKERRDKAAKEEKAKEKADKAAKEKADKEAAEKAAANK